MGTQFAITEDYGKNSLKQLRIHDDEIMNQEARFACALIERWGIVAGEVEGEDSAGRSVCRNATPAEVVARACSIAETALGEFRKRGWMFKGPDISELLRKTDD
jgi:hypothetical protein